ncbi:nuclear pore complex assembly-domain-containing protein [Phlyctochytrium arcticum]|nr:nuclear pore complex assembly-domain-containing protein [Phlyctochytrium arcticum]
MPMEKMADTFTSGNFAFAEGQCTDTLDTWFYRFNHARVEFHSTHGTERSPAGKLEATRLKLLKDTGPSQIQITAVTSARLENGVLALIICTYDSLQKHSRVWLFRPHNSRVRLSLLAEMGKHRVVALSVTKAVLSDQNDHEQYLIVGTRDNIYQFFLQPPKYPSNMRQWKCTLEKGKAPQEYGTLTSLTTYLPPNGRFPIIIVGRERGWVETWTTDDSTDAHSLKQISNFRLEGKHVPVTHLIVDGPERSFRKHTVLFAGQSEIPPQVETTALPRPSITLLNMDEEFCFNHVISEFHVTARGTSSMLLAIRAKRVDNEHELYSLLRTFGTGDAHTDEVQVWSNLTSNTPHLLEKNYLSLDVEELPLDIWAFESSHIVLTTTEGTLSPFTNKCQPVALHSASPPDGCSELFPALTSDHFPYSPPVREDISAMRERHADCFFIDRMLLELDVEAPRAYPPHDIAAAKELLAKVQSSALSPRSKQSLLLYLFKDWQTDVERQYIDKNHVARSHAMEVAGEWEFDHGRYEEAVGHLGDPTVQSDATQDVIKSLLAVQRAPLAMTLWRATREMRSGVETSVETELLELELQSSIQLMDGLTYLHQKLESSNSTRLWNFFMDFCQQKAKTPTPKFLEEFYNLPLKRIEQENFVEFVRRHPEGPFRYILLFHFIRRSNLDQATKLLSSVSQKVSDLSPLPSSLIANLKTLLHRLELSDMFNALGAMDVSADAVLTTSIPLRTANPDDTSDSLRYLINQISSVQTVDKLEPMSMSTIVPSVPSPVSNSYISHHSPSRSDLHTSPIANESQDDELTQREIEGSYEDVPHSANIVEKGPIDHTPSKSTTVSPVQGQVISTPTNLREPLGNHNSSPRPRTPHHNPEFLVTTKSPVGTPRLVAPPLHNSSPLQKANVENQTPVRKSRRLAAKTQPRTKAQPTAVGSATRKSSRLAARKL